MSEEKTKVEINVVQVVASALAAVTSAVLLSTLGTAGTLIGAALGSVIATTGAAIYSYSLRVSRERVQAAQAAAVARMSRVRTGVHTRPIELDDKPADEGRPPWREALSRLPWKWISVAAAAVFAVTMVVILSFELLTGRSVSMYTGGTDGSGHRTSVGFGSARTSSPSPSPTPSTSSTPSATSSSEPSNQGSTPSPTSSASQAPTTAAPSTSPSPSTTLKSPSATASETASPAG